MGESDTPSFIRSELSVAKMLTPRLYEEDRLWFPGLAAELVREFILHSQVDRSLVDGYSTSRWLADGTEHPGPSGGEIRIGPHLASIEYLTSKAAAGFEGLHFADRHDPETHDQIQAAVDLLMHVPRMTECVGSVVKSIHPLQSPIDHDVSHSTPALPFSVFFSIPKKEERDATIRVAESLIHEAMHLQLTLVNLFEPLVVDDRANGYSPWKEEVRPVAGLLHGIYVFAVIHQALVIWMEMRDDWRPYCQKRTDAIKAEVASLPETPLGLSDIGINLWRRCRGSILA